MAFVRLHVLVVLALAGAGTASAQGSVTYRCVDAQGRSTYTNIKEETAGRRCTVVSREVSVVPSPAPRVPSPAPATAPSASAAKAPAAKAAPVAARVSASDRRRILEEELSHEEKRLAEARQKLAEQQAIRTGDERNYQRVLDRLQPYIEAVEQHERNISQLRRELAR